MKRFLFIFLLFLVGLAACKKNNWKKYDKWIVGEWGSHFTFYGPSTNIAFQKDGTWYTGNYNYSFNLPGGALDTIFMCEIYEFCSGCTKKRGSQYDSQNFKYYISKDTLFLSALGYPTPASTTPELINFVFEIEMKNKISRDELIMIPINDYAQSLVEGFIVDNDDEVLFKQIADEKECD